MTDQTTEAAPAQDTARITHANLPMALAAFQAEMPTVGKGRTARVPTKSGGAYTYSYADIADLSRIVIPLLSRHGLAFLCAPAMGQQGYELVGRLLHESGEEFSGSLPLYGNTSQDIGGSITYMRRYLLGCLTGVVTDEDTDAAGVPGDRPQQQNPRAKTEEPLTQEQFVAIKEYADSGYPVDDLMFRQWGEDVTAKNMTRTQGDVLLKILHDTEK